MAATLLSNYVLHFLGFQLFMFSKLCHLPSCVTFPSDSSVSPPHMCHIVCVILCVSYCVCHIVCVKLCVSHSVFQYVGQFSVYLPIFCIFDKYVNGVKGPIVKPVSTFASTVRLMAVPLAKIKAVLRT